MDLKRSCSTLKEDSSATKRICTTTVVLALSLMSIQEILPTEILLIIASFCDTVIPLALTSKFFRDLLQQHSRAKPSLLLRNPRLFQHCLVRDNLSISNIFNVGIRTKTIPANEAPFLVETFKSSGLHLLTFLSTLTACQWGFSALGLFAMERTPVELLIHWGRYAAYVDSVGLMLYSLQGVRLDELSIQPFVQMCLRGRSQNCLAVLLDYTFYLSAGYSESVYSSVINSCILQIFEMVIAHPENCVSSDVLLGEPISTFRQKLFASANVREASLILPSGNQSNLLSRDFYVSVLTYMFHLTERQPLSFDLFFPIFSVTITLLTGQNTLALIMCVILACQCQKAGIPISLSCDDLARIIFSENKK